MSRFSFVMQGRDGKRARKSAAARARERARYLTKYHKAGNLVKVNKKAHELPIKNPV